MIIIESMNIFICESGHSFSSSCAVCVWFEIFWAAENGIAIIKISIIIIKIFAFILFYKCHFIDVISIYPSFFGLEYKCEKYKYDYSNRSYYDSQWSCTAIDIESKDEKYEWA